MQANLACPACHTQLSQFGVDELVCPADGMRFPKLDGIWHLMLPGRFEGYQQFIREYETIRRAEGRASPDPAYYRCLPYQDLSGKMEAAWRIRATSFEILTKMVIEPARTQMQILDLGAGNGWLSNRLAAKGHQLLAVDLLSNDFDGLGCHRFYETSFTPIQAEFDRLPCPDHSADMVIFNASLHYAVDVRATLVEALRVLRPMGKIVVMDSPVYRNGESGKSMVREREEQFLKKYGFPSNALQSVNYFTQAGLKSLGDELNINWKYITPFYGIRWELKPIASQILGRREPARFHLIIGQQGTRPA